jgi:murein DD-endopeptidase MepM/ murein hydrolase activator NlpD
VSRALRHRFGLCDRCGGDASDAEGAIDVRKPYAILFVSLLSVCAVACDLPPPGGGGGGGDAPEPVANAAAAPPEEAASAGFQLPFPCGQQWRLDTWGHAPALDMVREPDQTGTEGAQLVAPANGVVNRSFTHDNAGNVIQIDHGDGQFTTYLHLESRSVDVGDQVAQGQEIGRVGRTGPTSNNHPHLHYEFAIDADGDGSASWGTATSERVRPTFDGVEFGQSNSQTWRNVTSNNSCA